jgi:hypothetical protein
MGPLEKQEKRESKSRLGILSSLREREEAVGGLPWLGQAHAQRTTIRKREPNSKNVKRNLLKAAAG